MTESANIPKEALDAFKCKMFAQSLRGPALKWFSNLQEGSITGFKDLSKKFIDNYQILVDVGKLTEDLTIVVQGWNETLRDYIQRFSKAMVEIPNVEDRIARFAFKNRLHYGTRFHVEPKLMSKALDWACRFINLEDIDK